MGAWIVLDETNREVRRFGTREAADRWLDWNGVRGMRLVRNGGTPW